MYSVGCQLDATDHNPNSRARVGLWVVTYFEEPREGFFMIGSIRGSFLNKEGGDFSAGAGDV